MAKEEDNSLYRKSEETPKKSEVTSNNKQLTGPNQNDKLVVSWQNRIRNQGAKLIDQILHLVPDIIDTLDIRTGTDEEGTKDAIREGVVVKGYNVWILAASALLASIGLDTNSTAVIIGAMLISPLMNPILGVGLGLGINDWNLSKTAVYNLGIATGASLLTSLIYFWLTPLGDATPEILARTKPTLLDVGVAIFGGIAGIVSNSRIEKTNAIPGVAIATALMPPLCVSGFGLATLDLSVFFGAFYLFFINAVFISISTFIMVRFFGFKPEQQTDRKTRRNINYAMLGLSLVVIIPSIIFLLSIINQARTNQKIREIIIDPIDDDYRYEMIKWEIAETDTLQFIKLYVSSQDDMSDLEKDSLNNLLVNNGLGDYQIDVSRVSVSKKELDEISVKTEEEIAKLRQNFESLNTDFDSLRQVQQTFRNSIIKEEETIARLQSDLQIFYPDLFKIEKIIGYDFSETPDTTQQKIAEEDVSEEQAGKKEFYAEGLILKYGVKPPKKTYDVIATLREYWVKSSPKDSLEQDIGLLSEKISSKDGSDFKANLSKTAITSKKSIVEIELIWQEPKSIPDKENDWKIRQYIAKELNLEIPHYTSEDSLLKAQLDELELVNMVVVKKED